MAKGILFHSFGAHNYGKCPIAIRFSNLDFCHQSSSWEFEQIVLKWFWYWSNSTKYKKATWIQHGKKLGMKWIMWLPLVKFLFKALKTLKEHFKKYRISAPVLFYKEKTENSIIDNKKRVMFQHLHPQLKHVWVAWFDNGKIQYYMIPLMSKIQIHCKRPSLG